MTGWDWIATAAFIPVVLLMVGAIVKVGDWLDRRERTVRLPDRPRLSRAEFEAEVGLLADWQWERLCDEHPDLVRMEEEGT